MKPGWMNIFLITGILVSLGMVALYALRLGSAEAKPSDPYVLVIWAAFAVIYILMGLRRWVWPPRRRNTGAGDEMAGRD